MLDLPVEIASTPHTTALGAAMLAFVALGAFPSLDAAGAAIARPSWIAAPDARASAQYDDYYHRWRAMTESFAQMAREA